MRHACAAVVLLLGGGAVQAIERVPGPPRIEESRLRWSAYRVFDARDGLPQSAVYAMAQDENGVVYAGTEDGVAHFDGGRWQALPLPAGAAPPNVADLLVDAEDGLWVATDTHGVLHAAPGPRRFLQVPTPGAGRLEVEDLASAGGDAVWVATSQGLLRCRPARCEVVPALAGRPVNEVLALDRAQEDLLWLGIEGDGIYRLERASSPQPRLSPRVLGREDGLPNASIRALLHWQGALWIGTGRGLARWDGSVLTVYDAAIGFTDGIVYALHASSDEHGEPLLRAAQNPGGVIEIRSDGRWRRSGVGEGLPEDSAFSLLEARVAPGRPPVLWIGTVFSGVARLEPGSWQAMDERAGLPHRALVGLGRVTLFDGRRRYWAGSTRGAVIWEAGRWQPWLPDELAQEAVYDLAPHAGALWFATRTGLYRWDGREVRRYYTGNSAMPGLIALGLHRERDPSGRERLWIMTRHGMALHEDGVLRVEREPEKMLGDALFRDFAETGRGSDRHTRWLAGQGGVVFDRGQGWQPLPEPCLAHRDVMDLQVRRDPQGREALWIGTRGGLTRVDADRLDCRRLGAPALGKPTVYQTQFDRRGRAYLFGYDGVKRLSFDPEAPEDPTRARIEHFGLADGLPSLEFMRGVALVDDDGRIWGGGSGGIALYDPAQEEEASAPAPLRLLEASVLPEGTGLRPDAVLDPGVRGLRFDYRLVTARREHRIRYRTELIGLDPAPGPWQVADHVEYPRLPPGNYRFRVWGRDDHGVESGPQEVAFAIARPVWQQPWALAAFAALLLGAGVVLGRLRAHAFAQRARQLEAQVQARTAELAEANARLQQASLTDPLTGLGNRRRFHAALPELLERSPALALLLLDLDHFKRINDAYGHDAGDAVLRELPRRLQRALPEALGVRWGGEEFLIALSGADAAAADDAARALLALLRETPVTTAQGAISWSASIGWVCMPWPRPDAAPLGIDAALGLADQALYRAKHSGRDRAVGALPGREEDERVDPPGVRVRWCDSIATAARLLPFRR